MGVSLMTGILLSFGWGTLTEPEVSPDTSASTVDSDIASSTPSEQDSITRERTSDLSQAFSLEAAERAFAHNDALVESDPLVEAHLRCLIFAAPEAHMGDILRLLLETKNPEKFQEVACALFSRWTELNPEVALIAVQDAAAFSSQARRGVVTTWLNTDPDVALDYLLTEKSPDDIGYIKEFLRYKGLTDPVEAARLVDRISEKWSEADSKLFAAVANQWAKSEPIRAAQWAASFHDKSISQPLLKQMSVEVSRTRGRPALDMANLISDPKLRLKARDEVLGNWGRNYGAYALHPDSGPDRNISEGFPDDWTNRDIETFSRTFVDNSADHFTALVEIAKDDTQRMIIFEGAVAGVGSINPGKVSIAVESLPQQYAQGAEGKKNLESFIERWHKLDPKAANSWLAEQPPGAKTDVMGSALEKTGGEP